MLAWLVPCLGAWYAVAPWYDHVPGAIARAGVSLLHPGLIDAIDADGRTLVFVTSVLVDDVARSGAVTVDVNPLAYTYGAALFAALMLASRGRSWLFVAGIAVLALFQAWGVAFDFLASMVRGGLAQRAGFSPWESEAIALGYQAGSLLMPTLAPLLLWTVLQRSAIEALVRER